MKLDTIRKKLRKFFNYIKETGIDPNPYVIKYYFDKEDKFFKESVEIYTFYHYNGIPHRIYLSNIKNTFEYED